MSHWVSDVLYLLQDNTNSAEDAFKKKKKKTLIHKSHHVIKWVWGISWLWRIGHYFQSNLTQHWCAGVFREEFVDVFHDFWVYIYQFYITTTQTTPDRRGRSHLSILLLHFNTIFTDTWIAAKALIAKLLIYHCTRIFTHWQSGIENSLSNKAFGSRVKGGQLHGVRKRGAHLK